MADSIYRVAMILEKDEPGTHVLLNLCGEIFVRRYETGHNLADLDKAIFSYDRSVRLTQDFDSEQGARLADLGVAVWIRSKRRGGMVDLARARFFLEASLLNETRGVPDRKANLAGILLQQFTQTGEVSGLDLAIALLREAVEEENSGRP